MFGTFVINVKVVFRYVNYNCKLQLFGTVLQFFCSWYEQEESH